MFSPREMPRLRLILLLAAFAGLLALLLIWFDVVGPLLAGKLRRELNEVPPERLADHLEQLTQLGDAGIEALVDSLANERPEVATAAGKALEGELLRWQSLPTVESTRRVFHLAEQLAHTTGRLSPLAQRDAARIAQRILLWPIDRTIVDGTALVEHCAVMIRAGAAIPPPATLISVAAPENLESVEQRPAKPETAPRQDLDPPQAALIPHVEVPEAVPPAPTLVPHEVVTPPQVRSRTLLGPDPGSNEIGEPNEASPLDGSPSKRSPASVPSTTETARPAPSLLSPEVAISVEKPELRHLAEIEVMRALQSSSESISRAAEQELSARGFSAVDITLAGKLFDPRTAIRMQFVDALPGIAGIDPRPWLLWLARDESPAVRKAARSILATSNDPALIQRLRQIEREETDPGVREARAGERSLR